MKEVWTYWREFTKGPEGAGACQARLSELGLVSTEQSSGKKAAWLNLPAEL